MHKLNKKTDLRTYIITLCALFWAHGVFSYGVDYDRGIHEDSAHEQVEELQQSLTELSKQIEENDNEITPETIKKLNLKTNKNENKEAVKLKPNLGKSGLGKGKVNPAQVRQAIKMINSQFMHSRDEEIVEMIHTSLEGKPFASFLMNSKHFTNFAIGMLKDDKALLYLFELTQDRKVLKTALFVIIGLMILNFFLKRRFIRKDDFILTRILKGFTFFIFSTGLKMAILYLLYQDYLRPTVDVFVKRVL